MKPKSFAIACGFLCFVATFILGTALLTVTSMILWEYDVREIAGFNNNAKTMIPFAIGISAFLGILLGYIAGRFLFLWKQKSDKS